MLLINRQPGTKVIIITKSGERIEITALGVNNYGLNLGFEADKSIKIDREEKYLHDIQKNDNWGNR